LCLVLLCQNIVSIKRESLSVLGLGWKSMNHRRQLKRRRCERCGLYYSEKLDSCAHCGTLDEAGLQKLKARIASQQNSRVKLGRWFVLGAAVLVVLVFVVLTL